MTDTQAHMLATFLLALALPGLTALGILVSEWRRARGPTVREVDQKAPRER